MIDIFRFDSDEYKVDMFPYTGIAGYVPCEQIKRGYVPEPKVRTGKILDMFPTAFLQTGTGMN